MRRIKIGKFESVNGNTLSFIWVSGVVLLCLC